MSRVVVSLAGPAGAGKSQLALVIVKLLGEDVAARVPMDWFILPRDAPMERWLHQPLAWDHEAVRALLDTPDSATRLTPPFDFTTFMRSDATGERKAVPLRPVMVLDAMEPWPGAGFSALVDVPASVRHRRIADRDTRWESRVLDRWEQLERTWRHIEARAGSFDLILDGERPVEENAGRIVAEMRSLGLVDAATHHEAATST